MLGMYSGGTMEDQHQRTVEMLEEKVKAGDLVYLLWLLYDSQTQYADLKRLAQIAQERDQRRRATKAKGV